MSSQRAFKRAVDAFERRSLGSARKAFEKILKTEPDHLDARYLLGTLYAEQGKRRQAFHHLNIAADLDPGSAKIRTNLGILYQLEGDLVHAEEFFRAALRRDDSLFQAYFNLAVVLHKQHRLGEALATLDHVLMLTPHLFDAHLLIAKVHKEANDAVQAEISINKALELQPKHVESLHFLANLLAAQERYDEAKAVYERIVAAAPEDDSAVFALRVLNGERPAAPPRQHVQGIFNELADSFDTHLEELGYEGPHILREMLAQVVSGEFHFQRMLDIGCGTGGAGQAFRGHGDYLFGIDIAERMVDICRETDCYDKLKVADVRELAAGDSNFDLVVAADVLPYFGDLGQVFPAIQTRMAEGGILLLTAEHLSKDHDYGVDNATGRYQVSEAYLRQVAQAHGFQILALETKPLRRERGQWLEGYFAVWRKA
jgi:predicted TPR repeat methyltransferase